MAQIEQSDGGKKKKGAQKKMHIHVDFTPMVDMNMLLITFFMLCTTMIKSQTLSIALPAPVDPNKQQTEQPAGDEVNERDAVTIIIDTERNDDNSIKNDEKGNPLEVVYYYEGFAPEKGEDGKLTPEGAAKIKAYSFEGNTQEHGKTIYHGIREILHNRNKVVAEAVNELKKERLENKIDDETFNAKAKEIREANKASSPKVTIKATDGAAWQSVISALDEMQINQISQYRIGTFTEDDQLVIDTYKANNPK